MFSLQYVARWKKVLEGGFRGETIDKKYKTKHQERRQTWEAKASLQYTGDQIKL